MELKTSVLASWIKGNPSVYQLRDKTHFPDWGWLIILDAFLNNLASGMMISIALIWCFAPAFMVTAMPIAMTLALIVLIADLICLIADLGDPPRFIHAMRVMRFTSPLSVGVWGLSAYGIFLGIAVVLSWLLLGVGPSGTVFVFFLTCAQRAAVAMAVMAAIVVICYKGVVFSCSSQPGLCQARWLTPFMVSDSLLMGMSVMAILYACVYPQSGACILLVMPMLALLIARCITFALLWQDVKERARLVYDHSCNRNMALGVYVGGGILPLFMIFCGPFWICCAAILILAAGLVERAWLIGLPRPIQPGNDRV